MTLEALGLRAEIALCIAMLMLGAVMAMSSANAVKRVGGVVIAQIAALLAAGVLVGGDIVLVGAAMLAGTLTIGCALIVRLQERYGGVDMGELDAADTESEPREPGAT